MRIIICSIGPALRYMFDDYLEDTRAGHRIVASVYVETQAMARPEGPKIMRPLGEIEFANGVGAMADSTIYGDCPCMRCDSGITRICAAVRPLASIWTARWKPPPTVCVAFGRLARRSL